MSGLLIVYTYFQIPLMVIIFLPALGGLRREWWEASSSLGGRDGGSGATWAGPSLPSFLGALLLLFANAFSAYATAAALVSQGSPIVPLRIRGALTTEVVLGQANVGKALALGMIVVVASSCSSMRSSSDVLHGGSSERRAARTRADLARGAILVLVGGYLLLPLVAMLDFSTRAPVAGARSTRGSPSARTRTSSSPSSSRSRSPR